MSELASGTTEGAPPDGDMDAAVAALTAEDGAAEGAPPAASDDAPAEDTAPETPPEPAAEPATPAAETKEDFDARVAAAAAAHAERQAAEQLRAREQQLAEREQQLADRAELAELAAAATNRQGLLAFMQRMGWSPDSFAKAMLEGDDGSPQPVAARQVEDKVAKLERQMQERLEALQQAQAAAEYQAQYQRFVAAVPTEAPADKYPTIHAWFGSELPDQLLGQMRQMYASSGGVTPSVSDAAQRLEAQLSARVKRFQGQGDGANRSATLPTQRTITNDMTSATDAGAPQEPEDEAAADEFRLRQAVRMLTGE